MMLVKKYLIVIMLCCLLGVYSVNADVMESKNYRLESDEINMGAIGEMRDFSSLSPQEKELALAINQNPKQGPVVLFTHKISVWEIIFGSALALLLLVFVYYLVPKKNFISQKMRKDFSKKVLSTTIISILLFSALFVFLFFSKLIVKAQGMTSTNYKIISSDINAGGRDDQTSTTSSYKMQDTIGGIATGISESALYKLMAGYRTLDDLSISFSISDLAIGFGTFSATTERFATADATGSTSAASNGQPTVITITTNAPNGAIVSARSKGSGTGVEGNGSAGLYKSSSPTKLIAAAASSAVVTGTEGYGLYVKNVANTTGTLTIDAGFDDNASADLAISTTNQTIAAATAAVNATADVALNAAIASTTSAGSYADIITLTGTGKF